MKKLVLVLMIFALCVSTVPAYSDCTAILVGKDASPTGYPIIIHNEDNGVTDVIPKYWVPAKNDWPSGYTIPAEAGRAAVPQVASTFGFYYMEHKSAFGTAGSNSCGALNENGVIIVSNSNPSYISAAQYTTLGEIKDGGIQWALRRIVAERATSAKHAVELYVELLGRYGYTGGGRAHAFADSKEIWQVQISGGNKYVAVRLPDDHIALMPNGTTIQNPDVYRKDGPYGDKGADVIYPSNLISFIRDNNLYHPNRGFTAASADSDFEYDRSYSGDSRYRMPYNTYRHAFGTNVLAGVPLNAQPLADHDTWIAGRVFGFSYKVNTKVNVGDLLKVISTHYEDTPWDALRGYSGDPHGTSTRVICSGTTNVSKIFQMHSDPKLCTVWVAYGHPCALPFVPLHPVAYGPNIDTLVPEGITFPTSESASRIERHFVTIGDHIMYKGHNHDKIRSFQFLTDATFNQNTNAVREMNRNYLVSLWEENLRLVSRDTAPTVAELASFDRNASNKAVEMQEEYINSNSLLGIPISTTALYIDRTDASQTEVDIIFELPSGKTPRADNLRLALGSIATANSSNIVSGSLQPLGGDKWKFRITKANLTGNNGVQAAGNPGLYLFSLQGDTTDATTEYFSGNIVLNITDGPVDFALNVSLLTPFPSVVLDTTYTPPSAQSVILTNTGTSSLMLDQPTSQYYDISKLPMTTLVPGNSISFDICPKEGLEAGNYDEAIKITGANINEEVNAYFTVVPADYIIDVSSLDLDVTFTADKAPYTQPEAKTVTITNGGTGVITLNQPTATNFEIGTLSTTTLAPGETATFTIQPKANLVTGTYVDRINLTGSGGANSTFVASFTVLGSQGGGGGCSVGYGLLALAVAVPFVVRKRK